MNNSVNPAEAINKLTPEQRERMTLDHRVKVKTMALSLKNAWAQASIILFWIIALQAIALYFFTRGFLLSRPVLENYSTCDDLTSLFNNSVLKDAQILPQLTNSQDLLLGDFNKQGCWYPKTFDRAVIVVIDALRFDFTVPGPESSKNYLNSFPFMYDTSVSSPENALLLKFIADPPTTTLQRLKGLTTGSLPTFMDAGSNFAGTEIYEDSWVSQLSHLSNRSIAFTGDDTWDALFSHLFNPNMTIPYESLNVMDLDTVDNGVIENIFPFIQSPYLKSQWKVAIGHMLGVDHAGHRYGPEHPAMHTKLEQMNEFLKNLTEAIDDETLLIVMGDHGMDPRGDHGGESLPELEAALWLYSKTPFLGRLPDPDNSIYNDFNYGEKYREVSQIDLVPTLSLLLGLPIPFNNLGFPIAEAFLGTESIQDENNVDYRKLALAQLLTAAQMRRYSLQDGSLPKLDSINSLWNESLVAVQNQISNNGNSFNIVEATRKYHDEILNEYRTLWIKFDIPSMVVGLTFMVSSILIIYTYSRVVSTELDDMSGALLKSVNTAASVLGMVFWVVSRVVSKTIKVPAMLSPANSLLLGIATGVSMGFLVILGMALFSGSTNLKIAFSRFFLPKTMSGALALAITIFHSLMLSSNSFTVWEDRSLLFLLSSLGLYYTLISLRKQSLFSKAESSSGIAANSGSGSSIHGSSTPEIIPLTPQELEQKTEENKRKIMAIYFSVAFLIILRLVSYSTVCREEQGPDCKTTFYVGQNSTVSSLASVGLLAVASLYLPTVISSFYETSASMNGQAIPWIKYGLRILMLLVTGYKLLDGLEAKNFFVSAAALEAVTSIKLALALTVLGVSLIAANYIWWVNSLCIKIEISKPPESQEESKKVVTTKNKSANNTKGIVQASILGYSNMYGSMIFLAIINVFVAILMVSKPMAGLSLCCLIFQILAIIELYDIHGNSLYFSALGPITLGLLGSFHFFTTGHQATLSSVQWDVAYIPSPNIMFPVTHLALIFNTLGPQILTSLATPLLVLWKIPPSKTPLSLLGLVLRACLTFVLYQSVITLSAMFFAMALRRHLMVWKIFAPRFMLAALSLGVVDVCIFLAVIVIAGRSITFVNSTFNK